MLELLVDLGADVEAQALDKAWDPRNNSFNTPIQLAWDSAQMILALAGGDTSRLSASARESVNDGIRALCVRQYARAMLAGKDRAGRLQSGEKKKGCQTLRQISAMAPQKVIAPFFARLPGLCKTVGGLLLRYYNRGSS